MLETPQIRMYLRQEGFDDSRRAVLVYANRIFTVQVQAFSAFMPLEMLGEYPWDKDLRYPVVLQSVISAVFVKSQPSFLV